MLYHLNFSNKYFNSLWLLKKILFFASVQREKNNFLKHKLKVYLRLSEEVKIIRVYKNRILVFYNLKIALVFSSYGTKRQEVKTRI